MLTTKIQIEREVYKLADCFLREFRQHDYKKLYSMNPDSDSFIGNKDKYFFCFNRTVDLFSHNEEWDAYLFVKSLFEKYGLIYPHVLMRKQSWNDYLEYKGRFEQKETSVDILSSMAVDFKKMTKIMKEKSISSYEDFFKNKYVKTLITTNTFNSILFYFMNSFIKEYNKPSDKITVKKLILYRDKKIMKKLQEVLGIELYCDDVKEYINNI